MDSQKFGRIVIKQRGDTSYAYLPDREREADGSDFLELLGDTRELKAALKQCYQVLWNAKFDIPDMIDAKRAALKEIKRLLG